MKRWRCVVCGYIHDGESPPYRCPVCGAPVAMFEALPLTGEIERQCADSTGFLLRPLPRDIGFFACGGVNPARNDYPPQNERCGKYRRK